MSYELRVERVFSATVEEVFEAYTDAEAAKVWFRLGPDGPDDSIVEITNDLRVGGEWNAAWGDSPDRLFRERGVYQVVDRPRRLVMALTGWTPDGLSMDTTVEVTFEDVGGKTRMVVAQRGLPTEEVRDFFTTAVWAGAFDRIERYLALRNSR
ncbi:SRPBCC domain-containing protein [Planosporangium thailandense]|uniref:SRPBCC domain-containing protein n=1 Tax=Planosporangium thailandense TaxID=765197 RepID=A0ABX0XZ17_9ACTN|nr:SRPBCC domain-containing protein [Planosporangium thailandense]NJC71286.1 SRPBCC domain-containing protein [Planosporangium thailandense]